MLVELGNPKPVQCVETEQGHRHEPLNLGAPAVTYLNIPEGKHVDGSDLYGIQEDADLNAIARHLLQTSTDGVSHLPGHEALLCVLHPGSGMALHHFGGSPSWVRSSNPVLAKQLANFYDIPAVDINDRSFEDTHFTLAGGPGVVPGARIDLQANITQNGRDMWARALGGGQVGAIGAGTAATATTLTTASTFTTNQWAGCRVFVYSTTSNNIVFGNVVSNTNAAGASVLTVDQWYVVATPGGSAGTTPTTPWAFVIMDGNGPSWFMGLTATNVGSTTPQTFTSLSGEITTSGGGLIRKICPWAHTASANTYTLTPVYTANGSDSLPVTVASIGVFNSMVSGDTTQTIMFGTVLNASATLSASGDQLTVTETVTGT